jgi:hypothetical protein
MTTDDVDEEYVLDILDAMPPKLTREQFRQRCQVDVNAGYGLEVHEAERRYFETEIRQ